MGCSVSSAAHAEQHSVPSTEPPAPPLPPIRVISLENLQAKGTFPRYPDDASLVVDVATVDPTNSLFVFLSHCWIAGYDGAKDWRGKKHPDDLADNKYFLACAAIERIKRTFAPEMANCYIWIDYCSINQDMDPAGELRQLNSIIEMCDCIVTPIYDEDHESWEIVDSWRGMFVAYEAKAWRHGDYAYLNRAWCRVEMFFAANIPLRPDTLDRARNFEAGLKVAILSGRRPHILYGSREHSRRSLKILEPLQNSLLDSFSPLRGSITVPSDKAKIKQLMDDLQPYIRPLVVGYSGQRDAVTNKFEGTGTYVYECGKRYEGEWKNGHYHGYGRLSFSNGSVYEGHFQSNKRHGVGKMSRASGSVYEGGYHMGKQSGYGVLRTVNEEGGGVHVGYWLDDKRHGEGHFTPTDDGVLGGLEERRGYWEEDEYVGDRVVTWVAPREPDNPAVQTSTRADAGAPGPPAIDIAIDCGDNPNPKPGTRKPAPCHFYKLGKCRNGASCKFAH